MRFLLINLPLFILSTAQIGLLGLPLAIDIFAALCMFLIACFASRYSLLILFASITITSAAVNVVFSSEAVKPLEFYREHEKYMINDRYRPLVKDTISSPFGDLMASDPTAPRSLAEPRTIYFETDDLGFRNRGPYANQPLILNGDSFIVGNGMTQEDTLPELLTQSGVPSYSIAFPSDPQDYERRAENFVKTHPGNYTFAVFYYEGNDFTPSKDALSAKEPSALKKYFMVSDTYDVIKLTIVKKYLPDLNYPKLLSGMRQRVERRFIRSSVNQVRLLNINEDQIAFHEAQYQTTRAATVDILPFTLDPEVQKRTKCAFFIPTKLRVYSLLFGRNPETSVTEPAPGFVALQQKYAGTNVSVVDLTPVMRNVAFTLVEKRKYLFWRDDTHWNGNGTRAVLETVKSCLTGQEVKTR